MADVNVSSANRYTNSGLSSTPARHVAVSTDVVYVFYVNTDLDLCYRKSSDGGATWGDEVVIATGSYRRMALWFDKWTPGDSGALIHVCAANDSDSDLDYWNLDTSDDSLSTIVQVDGDFNPGGTNVFFNENLGITKAVGGDLYIAGMAAGASDHVFYDSADGVTWNSNAEPFDANNDTLVLLPDSTAADSNDIQAAYLDRTNNELTLKKYDQSGDSWSEGSSVLTVTAGDEANHIAFMIRHSDGDIIGVAQSENDSGTGDLVFVNLTDATTVDINTNTQTFASVDIFIDQNTDDLYAGYLVRVGPNNYWVAYKLSTTDGASWGSETAIGEGSSNSDDYKDVSIGGSTPGAAAGLMLATFHDEDNSILYAGVDGKVEISSGIDGTGAMTGPMSVMSGVGGEELPGSGSMVGPMGVMVGTGVAIVPAVGSGAMTGPMSVMAGAGGQELAGAGAMTGPTSVMVGTGSVIGALGSGAMTGPMSIMAGVGGEELAGSGAMAGPMSVMVGVGGLIAAVIAIQLVASEAVAAALEAEYVATVALVAEVPDASELDAKHVPTATLAAEFDVTDIPQLEALNG